jgi:shikimate kinase
VTVVLAGHRAAGKSRLLHKVGEALGRPCVDLDRELERRAGRSLREWVQNDEPGFRAAEREVFRSLPRGGVVAVGGGFLAAHREVLAGCVTVLVPVSFETYRERLLADVTRPRLRPHLSHEEELREVFEEREALHRLARPMSFVDFVLRLERGHRPRRVVTLPPGENAVDFAWRARHEGADLLEVRSDLIPAELSLRPVARALPLLVAQRTPTLPPDWAAFAELVDRPLGAPPCELHGAGLVLSLHADAPLSTREALARWEGVPDGALLKHVEPLGTLEEAPRLLETRAKLAERYGAHRVTVLATGPLALPFRAVLAADNALDYLALDENWSAAPGQRLLRDARREWLGAAADLRSGRLGLLGRAVAHSMSPRLHPAPFDRIELPADVDLAALLAALRPYYRGFAVTTPFKQRAAQVVGAPQGAVNTLVRTASGYRGASTDAAGAGAVLDALGAKAVTVLGRGGVAPALEEAARERGITLTFVRAADVTAEPLRGAVVWTWPTDFTAPPALRFDGATVAVIAYGKPSRRVVDAIHARGGVAKRLGPRWFIAQLRAQRALWPGSSASSGGRDDG